MSMPPPLPPRPTPSIEYALPASFAPVTSVHREGALIVAPPRSHLPAGCVLCGEPEVKLITRKLSWHHPALFLLILPGLLIYALVAMAVSKKGVVTFGLCERHVRRRRARIAIGAIGAFASLIVAIYGMILAADRHPSASQFGPAVLIVGLLSMIACLIVLLGALPVLKPKRIDDYQMRLGGAGPRYLDSLNADVPTATLVA